MRVAMALTAIRLGDLRLCVGRAEVDGCMVCMPCVTITFREEKYDDIQGPRESDRCAPL